MQNCVSQTPFDGSCPLQKWQATQTLVLLKDGIKVGPHDLEKLFCLQGNSKISHTALFQTQASKSNKRKLQHQDVRNESDDWSNAPFQSRYHHLLHQRKSSTIQSGDGKRRESKRCSGAPLDAHAWHPSAPTTTGRGKIPCG